jgi:hypothetical protein
MIIRHGAVGIGITAAALISMSAGTALAGGHTWRFSEIFSDSTGTIQFIELREAFGGDFETATAGRLLTTSTAPAHSFVIPGPNVSPPTGFRHLLFATQAFADLPGAPTPDYILPPGPFFSLDHDTIACTGWPNFVFASGGLPLDGVHSRNTGGVIACNSPTNYAGQTATLNIGCALQGDMDGSGVVDGDDVEAFVRATLNASLPGDNAACAEYCLGGVAAHTAAFVDDLLGN